MCYYSFEWLITHLPFILFQHKYISIAEIQITKEEEYQKTPLSVVCRLKNNLELVFLAEMDVETVQTVYHKLI